MSTSTASGDTYTVKEFSRKSALLLVGLFGWAALAVALFILTAPPLMIAMTRHNPREWPRIYQPLARGFQCDWTRPLFTWYFDTVWRADTEIRGE